MKRNRHRENRRPWLAALLATALLPFGITANAESESPYAFLINDDPESLERLARYHSLEGTWLAGWVCTLLASDHPMVRLRALLVAEHRRDGLFCAAQGSAQDLEAQRQDLIREGWSDKVLLQLVFRAGCGSSHWENCDNERVARRSQELDGDNAAALVLLLDTEAFRDDGESIDARVRNQILRAARAPRFDTYLGAGLDAVYQESLAYLQDHPAPQAPRELADNVHAYDALVDTEYTASLLTQQAHQLGGSVPRSLTRHCRTAAATQDPALEEACKRLGELMIDRGQTYLDRAIGAGIISTLVNPGQQVSEDWRTALGGLEHLCSLPVLLNNPEAYALMPVTHRVEYIEDLAQHGEIAALRAAAEREFAAHPDRYTVNPSDCEALYTLDEATQEDLVALSRTGGAGEDRLEPFLAGLAEALEDAE